MSSTQLINRPRLIIIRDEGALAADIKDTLQHLGYDVLAALTSLDDAVEFISEVSPDLVIMDIFSNGGVDGITTAKIIRDQLKIPVIILISDTDIEIIKQAEPTFHFYYILKPFNDKDLNTAIQLAMHVSKGYEIRKVPKKVISEHEKRFNEFAQLLPGIVCETDEDGKIIFINRKANNVLNYDENDFANGINILQIFDSMDRDRVLRDLTKISEQRNMEGVEYTALRKDGTTFSAVMYANAIMVANKPSGFRIIVIDATESKAVQKELQISNDLLRAVIEAAPVAIMDLDLEGRVHSVWNPAAEKMLGWTARDAIGRFLPSVPAERQDEFRRFREKIIRGEALKGIEVCRRKRDGSQIDYSIYGSPLRDSEGRIVGNIAVLVDITERKAAENALKESEAKYIDLYENAPVMYLSVDPKTSLIKECNNTAANILGYSKDEIVGRPIFGIYHPDCLEEVKKTFRAFVETGEIQDKELQLLRKDGTKLDVSLNVSSVRGEDGGIISSRSILRDITEHKRNEVINSSRLHLIKFAARHTLDELLEETLNVTEKLTGSLIGFYHFVDDDQKTLTLQNWSKKTKDHFCRADGKGRHYAISDAGVWVDCIYQRKPVIHNDYNSLPHRKGTPDGHAEVIRELVVPVFRCDKIKAILGVGNKLVDYTERDVETVSLLADLAWEVAERKLVDDALRASEERYRIVADNTYDWEFWISPSGRFLYNSPSCLHVTGHNADEFTRDPDLLNRIIHPEDRRNFRLHEQQAQKEIKHSELDFRIILPDGSTRHIGHVCQPVYDDNGRYLGRRGSNRDITESKQAEDALRESEERFRSLVEQAAEGFFLHDEGKILDVNKASCDMLGYSREELLGLSINDIDTKVIQDHHPEVYWEEVSPETNFSFESEHRRRDGTRFPVEVNLGQVEFRGKKLMLGLVRDITERKQAEMALHRLNRELRAISNCNQTLLRAIDEQILLNDICRIVCDEAGYRMAWVGYAERDEAKTVRPVAWAGVEDGYLAAANITWADTERGRGPIGAAIRTGESACIQDFSTAPQVIPWRENAVQRGYRSCIALPLKDGTAHIIGALCIYSTEPNAFTPDETRLMEELAGDLAFGITTLRIRAEHKKRETQILASEQLFRALVENSPDFIARYDREFRRIYVNPAIQKLFGKAAGNMLHKTPADQSPVYAPQIYIDQLRQVIETATEQAVEMPFRTAQGEMHWGHMRFAPEFGPDGQVASVLAIGRDINEIKKNEQRFRMLAENFPDFVLRFDHDGRYTYVNPAVEKAFGMPAEAFLGKTLQDLPQRSRPEQNDVLLALIRRAFDEGVSNDSEVYWDTQAGQRIFEIRHVPEKDATGNVVTVLGIANDITERKQREIERLSNLKFFESKDMVNRAIQGANDLEGMMRDVLDLVLKIFDCDRAYLVYPCDPAAASWQSPMERHRSEYPGIFSLGKEMPMDPEVAESLRTLLDADGPVKFGPGTGHELPAEVSKRFGFKSFMAMALYPKLDKPWQFGIHQCSYARIWTAEEERLLLEIGRRLGDALTTQQTLRNLRKSEEFLNNIVENIPNMIFVKDKENLSFVRLNKAGEQLLGYSREELLGKNDYDFFPKNDADFFTAKDREVLSNQELVDIPEEMVRTRTNEERILHTKKIPILDEAGLPQYLLGISEDITERKQAEEFIRKLSLAIEQSPVSIVITDTSGKIEFVNKKFSQATGYSYEEALGQNPRILKSGETTITEYQRLWEIIGSGGVWSGVFHNRKKNGELFWERATIAPIRNANNVITHYVGVNEDITQQVSLESQLRQAQKMESIGRLAGGVAHDFNNMLMAIIGYTELILTQVDQSNPLYPSLREIWKAGMRSAELTKQLLTFARKQPVAARVIDLNETVEGIIKMLRRLVGENIDLVWLPEKIIWPIKIDPTQVDQILANLCVNAADAIGDKGKITIETHTVTIDETYSSKFNECNPGDFVMLAFSDDGQGMDKEILDKIFEPFFTTKELGKGTGLGLATVYGIVKQNEGFIDVYSEPGHGTTFNIYLPRHVAKIERTRQESRETPLARGNETILLVEDETSILEMTRLFLDRLGYRVLAASTPSEAVLVAKEHLDKIKLLITDVVMPEMNGFELSKKLTTICPELKSLFMSGYKTDDLILSHLLNEGVNYIQKPFPLQSLATKVREVLNSG